MGLEPYWADDMVTLHVGDCLDVLREMPDVSVDAVVTDPPAGVAFMNKDWDHDRGGRDQWIAWLTERMAEAFRVLKPGGHALVWALPRTSHWTATALEDAGFTIRDCVVHLFGSGFPKSHDVSVSIDRAAGAERKPVGEGHWAGRKPNPQTGGAKVAQLSGGDLGAEVMVTAPATAAARRWSGWGTALKPGQEHWWLVRRPLAGTVASNVLEYGTGALNIDACRTSVTDRRSYKSRFGPRRNDVYGVDKGDRADSASEAGRWPTNLIFSHSASCVEDGPCELGGTITVPAYDGAFGVAAHSDEPAYLLDRLQALLRSLCTSSRNGTSLWSGAVEFYRSAGNHPFGVRGEASLLDGVSRALRLTGVGGSPGGCQSCLRSDGERVHRVLEAARAGLPSLLDALDREIRQAGQPGCIPIRQRLDPPSSSDGLPPAERLSCSHQSSTSGGRRDQLTVDETPARTPDTGCSEQLPCAPACSTQPNSTASPAGSSGTDDRSACTDATVRLLTLLAFDIASRFVMPNPGVFAKDVVTNLPYCPVAELDRQSGHRRDGVAVNRNRSGVKPATVYGKYGVPTPEDVGYGGEGGASRYFPTFRYEAKAPSSERPKLDDGTAHATVKPLTLLRWMVRLVTRPGGVVLDPFAGSGTTGEACVLEGFRSVLIELEQPHAELIKRRLSKPLQPSLFGEVPDAS